MSSMRTLMHPARADLSLPNVLYALADPIRLKVVAELAATEEGDSCMHIVAGMNVAKSTQSHHFKILRESGLLRMEPQGRRLLVTLRREDLEARFPGLIETVLRGYYASLPKEAATSTVPREKLFLPELRFEIGLAKQCNSIGLIRNAN